MEKIRIMWNGNKNKQKLWKKYLWLSELKWCKVEFAEYLNASEIDLFEKYKQITKAKEEKCNILATTVIDRKWQT